MKLMLHRREYHRKGWFEFDRCSYCDQLEENIAGIQAKNKTNCRTIRWVLRAFSKSNELFSEKYKNWLKGLETSFGQLRLFESNERLPIPFEIFVKDVFELLLKLCFHENSLPQGAPTSPYLLNLAIWFSGLAKRCDHIKDKKIGGKDVTGFDFSIYADDLTFSSYHSFGHRPFSNCGDPRTIKEMMIGAIEEDGNFKINPRKTRSYNSMKCHPLITGLRVVHNRTVLPKKKIRWLRSFFNHLKNSDNPKIIAQKQGWLSYLHMIYDDRLPKQITKVIC